MTSDKKMCKEDLVNELRSLEYMRDPFSVIEESSSQFSEKDVLQLDEAAVFSETVCMQPPQLSSDQYVDTNKTYELTVSNKYPGAVWTILVDQLKHQGALPVPKRVLSFSAPQVQSIVSSTNDCVSLDLDEETPFEGRYEVYSEEHGLIAATLRLFRTNHNKLLLECSRRLTTLDSGVITHQVFTSMLENILFMFGWLPANTPQTHFFLLKPLPDLGTKDESKDTLELVKQLSDAGRYGEAFRLATKHRLTLSDTFLNTNYEQDVDAWIAFYNWCKATKQSFPLSTFVNLSTVDHPLLNTFVHPNLAYDGVSKQFYCK